MSKLHTLDKVDRKLLNLLQKDNQTPTRTLADKVHISQPTCLRRIRDMRDAGIISADVAMIDPFALGYGMLAFLEVSLSNQSDEHMQEFEVRMGKEAEVMQCYFSILTCTAADFSSKAIRVSNLARFIGKRDWKWRTLPEPEIARRTNW